MGGFLTGLLGGLGQGLEAKHAQDEARKKTLREENLRIALDPSTPPAMRDQAMDAYKKASSPEVHKGLMKAMPMLGKILGHGQQSQPMDEKLPGGQPNPNNTPAAGQAAMPARPSQASAAPPMTMPGGSEPGSLAQPTPPTNTGSPAPMSDVGTSAQSAGAAALPPPGGPFAQYAEQQRQQKIADETAKDERTFNLWKREQDYAGAHKENVSFEDFQTRNKIADAIWGPKESRKDLPKDQQSAIDEFLATNKFPTGRGAGGSGKITNLFGLNKSLRDAKNDAATGTTFETPDGTPIDLDKLSPDSGLKGLSMGNKLVWVPYTPNQKFVTVGNQMYPVNQLDTTLGDSVGVSRVPSTHETIVMGPDNQPIRQPLTTTPSAPGATRRSGGSPAAAPSSGRGAPQAQGAPPAASNTGGGRAALGLPSGVWSQSANRVAPVRGAAVQLFGDPSQPTMTGLAGYANLADDPKSAQKVGKALRIFFDQIDAHEKASGGLTQFLSNETGFTQAVADAQNKVYRDALKDLSPQEKDAVDSTITAYSTIIGLRALTRASAAQRSAKALENDIPTIGISAQDSRQFYNKLQKIAEEVYNGYRTIPKQFFNQPGEAQFYETLPAKVQGLKDKASQGAGKKSLASPGGSEPIYGTWKGQRVVSKDGGKSYQLAPQQ